MDLKLALARLEQWVGPIWAPVALILLLLVCWLDVVTGFELTLSVFYLIPVVLAAWYGGRRAALAASVISTAAWLAADILSGLRLSNPLIGLWNAGIRFASFAIVGVLLAALKRELDRERRSARTDYRTGAASARLFDSLLQREIGRLARDQQTFTIAYLDIDNFKQVNDRFGHLVGDDALRSVVRHCRRCLRKTDTVARLGGDELIILLPETDAKTAACVIPRLHEPLAIEARRGRHPITMSIGVMTFLRPPPTSTDAIRLVDGLMYAAKSQGKNCTCSAIYPAQA